MYLKIFGIFMICVTLFENCFEVWYLKLVMGTTCYDRNLAMRCSSIKYHYVDLKFIGFSINTSR